jgi:hypothetical protein
MTIHNCKSNRITQPQKPQDRSHFALDMLASAHAPAWTRCRLLTKACALTPFCASLMQRTPSTMWASPRRERHTWHATTQS